eukprot:TRINITY_DN15026_c0_g1_i2.p1 TRINITY_DN15026_c0_g1~~TRINITY_DN15026_c0_g1_i2.p1  ORF type:complete len:242 (+),score=59.75 TRINITY_DN15026_c0_g1_i2:83-727(+)
MPPLGSMHLPGMHGMHGSIGSMPPAAAMPRRGMPDSFHGCHHALGAVGGIGHPGVLPQQRPLPMQQQGPCMHGMPQGLGNERFRGRIKSFNAKQGFGFIENPDAYAIFGRDVFLHKAQIGNLKVGTEVTYGVEMNKQGMPQARDLVTLDGQAPGPAPPNVAKDEKPEAAGMRDNRPRVLAKGAQKGSAQATMPGLLPDPAALGVNGGLSAVGAR